MKIFLYKNLNKKNFVNKLIIFFGGLRVTSAVTRSESEGWICSGMTDQFGPAVHISTFARWKLYPTISEDSISFSERLMIAKNRFLH